MNHDTDGTAFERKMQQWLLSEIATNGDAGHDMAHIKRVVEAAKKLALEEGADLDIVIPAAWLHDCVIIPKEDPRRNQASRLAADRAKEWLAGEGFDSAQLEAIGHAIEAHSFSAGISPETPEAKVVQDADRLDAIGAVGIARCFAIGGKMGASIYHPEEPFPENREADDRSWIVDHFFTKLLNLEDQFQTESGRREAQKRTEFMRDFLNQLKSEAGM